MSITISSPMTQQPVLPVKNRALTGKAVIPLQIYAVSLAALLTMVGILWDISWHRSIGRDTLLSPPHDLV